MLTRENLNTTTVSIGVALGILGIAYRWLGKRNERVPPGPPCYPVIGNVLNFPMQGWAEIFPEWHKKYGEHKYWSQYSPLTKPVLVLGSLIYANLLGTPVFVVGDREAAEELLNVRGKITASRPPNVLAMELCATLPAHKVVIDVSYLEWAGMSGT